MATNYQSLLSSLTAFPYASRWLHIQVQLGLSTTTVVAYARAILDYITFCQKNNIQHECANRGNIVEYVHYLSHKTITKKDGSIQPGLSNATMQQRIVAIRLYYDFLKEEGVLEINPIARGRYTKSKGFGVNRRGLLPHYKKLPWIPNEQEWLAFLTAAKHETARNRLMLSMAYDAGLRREELCSLQVGDIDPFQRLITLRAENTKTKRARVVPFSPITGKLLAIYTKQRSYVSRDYGLLFLSESRRNSGAPITIWTWSKIIHKLATKVGLNKFSTHTLRHLCLTDLSRMGWDIHEIASFAGHSSVETTMQYIHLSGIDLTSKLSRTINSVREQRIIHLAKTAS